MPDTTPTKTDAAQTKPRQFQTPQEQQFAQAINDFGDTLEKIGGRLSDHEKHQAAFDDAMKQISRLDDDFGKLQADYQKRFRAMVAEHVNDNGSYRGPFGSAEVARNFGKLCIALQKKDTNTLEEMHTAAMSSGTGESGGALLIEQMIDGIVRNVEAYGVFEANTRVIPMGSQNAKLLKRTQGHNVYYPDLGVSPTASDAKFANLLFNLTTYAALAFVDRSMFEDDLAIPLANFIAMEMAHALAQATDENGFIGDGSDTYARVVGLFKSANTLSVVADTGDDTFTEVINESSDYLADVAGTLPEWAQRFDPKWFMHRTVYFKYQGVRDSQNMPITDVMTSPAGPTLHLMGYPVVITQAAPAFTASAASTTMAVLSALSQGMALGRHRKGIEIRQSSEYRFAERQETFLLDVRQDITEIDGNASVQLKTAAS